MKLVQYVYTLLILTALLSKIDAARILGVFPMPSVSHYTLASTLMKGLAEKGHNVTVVSLFGENEKEIATIKGSYHDIILTGYLDDFNNKRKNLDAYQFMNKQGFLKRMFFLYHFPTMSDQVFKHQNMQALLKSDEKFDAVIVEQFFQSPIKILAHHYNAPLILFSPTPANIQVNSLVGNPTPSYIPNFLIGIANRMTLFQRIFNHFANIIYHLYNYLFILPLENQIVKNHFPNAPNLEDIIYNNSLVLLNSHPSFNQPVPHVPNMIEIGGFHLKPPKKLPTHLQEYLDSAKDGVIYFSMGSNLKTAALPIEKRTAILNSFKKLKQQVLWKWEDDEEMSGQPSNVKLGKWFPQRDILAHPKIKLFITHGGFLSSTETVYHGVPILAIPIFGDQHANAANAVANGYALSLAYTELTEEKFTECLNELLNNPKYRKNVQERSKLMRDRPMNPLDTATYWIEFAIRHKGAPHLRVGALDLAWYQNLLLDVIVFDIFIIVVLTITFYYITKKCCEIISRNKQEQSKIKQN